VTISRILSLHTDLVHICNIESLQNSPRHVCGIDLDLVLPPWAAQLCGSPKMKLFVKAALVLTFAFYFLVGPLFATVPHGSRGKHLPPGSHDSHCGQPLLAKEEKFIIESFSNVSISEWSYYYTSGAHLGGKNYSQAEWTREKWNENGIPSSIVAYNVFLNYPISHGLSLRYPDGSVLNATLEEDVLPEDSTTGYPNRIPTFHGYSYTGNATAEYVYVG
jgi:hypothetical protein